MANVRNIYLLICTHRDRHTQKKKRKRETLTGCTECIVVNIVRFTVSESVYFIGLGPFCNWICIQHSLCTFNFICETAIHFATFCSKCFLFIWHFLCAQIHSIEFNSVCLLSIRSSVVWRNKNTLQAMNDIAKVFACKNRQIHESVANIIYGFCV